MRLWKYEHLIESTFTIIFVLKRLEVLEVEYNGIKLYFPKTFWWRKFGVIEGNRISSNFTWSKSFQWGKPQTNLAPIAPNLCSFYLFSPRESITTLSGNEQCCSSETFIRATSLCQQNFHLIWNFHPSNISLSTKLSSHLKLSSEQHLSVNETFIAHLKLSSKQQLSVNKTFISIFLCTGWSASCRGWGWRRLLRWWRRWRGWWTSQGSGPEKEPSRRRTLVRWDWHQHMYFKIS